LQPSSGMPSGIVFSDGEQTVLSDYDREMIAQKKAQAAALANRPEQRTATLISIASGMSFRMQEKFTYCAPACVQMMLKYVTGDPYFYAQQSLAYFMDTSEQTGTLSNKIAPCLNNLQDDFYYVYEYEPQLAVMKNYIYSTVAYNRVPANICIYNPSGTNWYYATPGHALVVCGMYSDESEIQFMDPLAGTEWAQNCPPIYLKSSSFVGGICVSIVW